MEILLLGAGGCTPSTSKPNRSFAGFFIELDNDSLLFDIGPGSCVKLVQSGIDINKKPTHIFLSHLHPDHSADFVGFMQGRGLSHIWYDKNKKVRVFGGEGIKQFVDDVFQNVTAWKSFIEILDTYKVIDINEVGEGEIAGGKNWKVTTCRVEHYNSRAYRLDVGNKSLVYSGDMEYDENFSKLGKNCDIAIIECSFPERKLIKGTHLCPEDIGKLAKLGGFKRIVLTHMYPECEGREEEIVNKIHEFTSAEVIVGYDLLKIQV